MRIYLILPLCTTLLFTESNSVSAEPTEPDQLWSGDIEFGYVNVSGNTEETTVKTRAGVDRELDQWRYSILFESLNTETSGNRSAEKYFLTNRLAYQYNDSDYVFAYGAYDDDRFSGYDYQASIAGGYGRRILNDEIRQWEVEIGPGYRFSKVEDDTTADDSEEAILRLFTQYEWKYSDTGLFSQTVNIEAGVDNIISKSTSAVKVQIIGAFALKLSYSIKYSEEVPPENKHADTETAITLAYTF
jgi:putative salt-induced outer membrane protein YdiY